MSLNQDTRQISAHFAVDQPLEARGIRGTEEVSGLYRYELDVCAPVNERVDARQIVGNPVVVRLDQTGDKDRYLHGFVSEFRQAGWGEKYIDYRAVIVPKLWFLSQTSDCRIFQDKTTRQIVEQIFTELDFGDVRWNLSGDYQEHVYCVQYRESDLNFVSRLLEEEGIFYFFEHAEDKHTLVLADQPASFYDLDDNEAEFPLPHNTTGNQDQIKDWEHRYQIQPGSFAQRHFNFKTPKDPHHASQASELGLELAGALEVYDYHGRYGEKSRGDQLASIRMEEMEVGYDTVVGSSTYRSFSPGGQFKVTRHRIPEEEGKSFAITAIETIATTVGDYTTEVRSDDPGRLEFHNYFTAIPADARFRPKRETSKPVVEGPQTAIVVGPPNEEIYPDEHGRVKVQFHWDREGQNNEDSSCWIRVSQVHAGGKWGGVDLPRIGEEVIVDFIEGDPDDPIITGRVYNGVNKPPFSLPDEMTRSGMKSQTHKGSGYNEMSMDDTAGKEQIRVNAQHDMNTTVGNDQTLIVNNNRTTDIGNNDTLQVGNNSTESVGNNKDVTIGNNLTENVGNKAVVNAGSSITLKCGASKIHMTSGGMITITGTIITTAAAANASVVAPMTQVVGGVMLTTVGGVNMMTGGVVHVGAAGLASVSGSKVDLAATGTNAIKGGKITLN